MRKPPAGRRGERGNAMLELALGVSLLSLLLVGTSDLGPLFYTAIELNTAARAGVTYGAASPTNAFDTVGIQSAIVAGAPNVAGVIASSSAYYQCSDSETQYTSLPTCSSGSPMLYVSASATATWNPTFNYPGVAKPSTITRTAVMRAQ